MDFSDTIVAPITGVQRAPVAVIRISGEKAWDIAKEVVPSLPNELVPRKFYFGQIRTESVQDEGFVVVFEKGHSYTGELVCEISCHGSPSIVRSIIAAVIDKGGRLARPGEFTERAFMNGRIDLLKAESIRETINADTQSQLRRATALREGYLSRTIIDLRERVTRILAHAEATIDFSEEIGDLDRKQAIQEVEEIIAGIDKLLKDERSAKLMRYGLKVAIVGRPNVGKSTLLNVLLGVDRAIVTDIPGTTRDTIEEAVEIAGLPVVLTDTAGIRSSADEVEQIGVQKSQNAVAAADQVWFVCEAPAGWTEEDEKVVDGLGRKPDLVIANKADLGNVSIPGSIAISAVKRVGIEQITAHVKNAFNLNANNDLPLINERVYADLAETKDLLKQVIHTLNQNLPTDIATVDLYGALQSMGRITGETAPDEVISRVFQDFCIGK